VAHDVVPGPVIPHVGIDRARSVVAEGDVAFSRRFAGLPVPGVHADRLGETTAKTPITGIPLRIIA
jgi:hypothetical protein